MSVIPEDLKNKALETPWMPAPTIPILIFLLMTSYTIKKYFLRVTNYACLKYILLGNYLFMINFGT